MHLDHLDSAQKVALVSETLLYASSALERQPSISWQTQQIGSRIKAEN